MPPLPNVTAVNALGDYHIAADRLAFIDGEGMFGALFSYPPDVADGAWDHSGPMAAIHPT